MTRFRLTLAVVCAAFLQACMDAPTQTGTSASTVAPGATSPARTFLFSWGMFGDPVFDRDVETFTAAFTRAYGTPQGIARYGANSPRLNDPDVARIESDLARLAQNAVDGQDLVVVMLTSHGLPDSIAVQFTQGGPVAGLSADGLADLLQPLSNDRQILILQACFSGSLIDELQSPNRIILTASSATRSSFGCDPESDNTWFIKSLNRSIAQGGSWEQIFARTRTIVAQDEAAAGFPASNPQSFVGRNMRAVWTAGAI